MHRQRGSQTIFFEMRHPAIDGDQFGARAEPLDRRCYRSGASAEVKSLSTCARDTHRDHRKRATAAFPSSVLGKLPTGWDSNRSRRPPHRFAQDSPLVGRVSHASPLTFRDREKDNRHGVVGTALLLHTALGLARSGMRVVMTGRDRARTEKARRWITERGGSPAAPRPGRSS
jgi:hypothetical protein